MQFLWKYVDDLVGKGLDFKVLGEMLFYASFGLLPLAFPLAMLLASIMSFGSLGEKYELVAMKSSGISLFRIMRPLIAIAIIITLIAFYFSNTILPYTNLKFTTLMYSVRQQKPELILQEGVFTNEMTGYNIKVGRKDSKTNKLYDLLIYDHTNNNYNERVTVADSGFLQMTDDKKYMVLTLYSGVNYSEEKTRNRKERDNHPFRRDKFKEQTIRVRVRDFEFNKRDESLFKNSYAMLSISNLKLMEDSLNTKYYSRLRNYLLQININRPLSLSVFDITAPNDSLKRNLTVEPDSIFNVDEYFEGIDKWIKAEIIEEALGIARENVRNMALYQRQLYEQKKYINRHEMERHRKFTLSIAVLIFFFIGAPLGAIIRKGGLGMPVVVSILMFIAYYIISMTGEKSAREDVWQMVTGMWFSSFLFFPIGVWLTYKAATDSAIMSSETYTKFFRKLGLEKIIRKSKNEDSASNK
jgi:lipopolysaccharide export system permease protein